MATKSIKVLLLFSGSVIGGAERSLTRMAFANSNSLVSYQLATFGSYGEWNKWAESLAIKPFNYRIWSLFRYILINKPDVIYIIGFRLSVYLRLFCRIFTKCKLVQGVRWHPNSNSMLDRFFRFVERWLVLSFLAVHLAYRPEILVSRGPCR